MEQDLRSEIREILVQEAEIEQLEHQKKVLHERCSSISKESEGLKIRIGEEEEAARTMKAQFSSYRKKMGGHRVAVWHVSQAGAQQTLEEKREELGQDLENPNGSTVEKAQVERGSSTSAPCLDVKNLLLFMFSVVQKPAERDQCAEGGDLCDEEDGIWKEKATAEGDWNSYSDKKRYWGEKSLKSTPCSRAFPKCVQN